MEILQYINKYIRIRVKFSDIFYQFKRLFLMFLLPRSCSKELTQENDLPCRVKKNERNSKPVYRRELDGLRALAVIGVLFYHSNFGVKGIALMRGGYLGVDIFFVLSGFLITGIIRQAMDNHDFTFRNFYIRRIKRIVPAYFFILAIVAIGAYFFILPSELVKFAESLKSALYFGSNYFFYGEDSYIAASSIHKPLLHTWSLSVEWQFYIVYPFLFWLIYRFCRRYTFFILLVSGILSFLLAQWASRNSPDFAFYLLPTRAWELLFGGMLVLVNRERMFSTCKGKVGKLIGYLPFIGLLLITASMVFISDKVEHPSFLTVIPVAGTVLFILFCREGEIVTRFFSLKPVVFVGLVSFSLYLWHQPIFVFFRFMKYDQMRFLQFAGLSAISVFLAWLTYRFVETPFRRGDLGRIKIGFLVLFGGFCTFFSYQVIANDGFASRYGSQFEKIAEQYKMSEFIRLKGDTPGRNLVTHEPLDQCFNRSPDTACRFGDESWVTLGDSTVGVFEYALKERLASRGKGLIAMSYGLCPFFSTALSTVDVPQCPVVNEERWKVIESFRDKKHFLFSASYHLLEKTVQRVDDPLAAAKNGFRGGEKGDSRLAWESLASNVKKLIALGHDVTMIYPFVSPNREVPREMFLQMRFSSKLSKTYNTKSVYYDNAMKYVKLLDQYFPDQAGLTKVKPMEFMCEEPYKCLMIDENGSYFMTGDHFSYHGANEVLDRVRALKENK